MASRKPIADSRAKMLAELAPKHATRLKTEWVAGKPRIMSGHYFCEKCGKDFKGDTFPAGPCSGVSEDIF